MGLFSQRELSGIAAEALTFAREAAEDTHPNEFMGLLRVQRADRVKRTDLAPDEILITDVIIVPATKSSPVEATVRSNLVPNDGRTVGSIHSHPNGVLRPSAADLSSFGRGIVHIILGAPYGPDDWQAFDRDGDRMELPVLDVELEDANDFFDFDQHDIDRELDQ
jgi:proteasome lid subunit RPN8/RPN11